LVLPIIGYALSSKIRDKGKIVSAWKQGSRGEREGVGRLRERAGEGRRNDPNIVCTYE
jgi:hypothetical protein